MDSERLREILAADVAAVDAAREAIAASRESLRPMIDELRALLKTSEGTRAQRIAAIKAVGFFDGLSRQAIRSKVLIEKLRVRAKLPAAENLRETHVDDEKSPGL